jgi:purine-nucleoside phosphorylase
MPEYFTRREFGEAANFIREHTSYRPKIGMILGSGLSDLTAEVSDPDIIPYTKIPHFPVSSVEGHHGELVIGRWNGRDILVMRGRVHFYEGYSMSQVTLPVRAMQMLGVNTLFATNAAGGINPEFQAGDLMLITDHINLLGMAGQNPLRGPNDEALGPRFPDMSQVYDPSLQELALDIAEERGLTLRHGVYAMLAGPSFETPVEIRFLRLIGADAVGMSTVNEATVARHGGMRILAISLISNVAVVEPQEGVETTHEEVLAAGALAVPRLSALIGDILGRMPEVA